ncbi:MAG: hypothetical protein ACYDHH_25700 [Solirubrobacteraceae bacterium]
MATISERASGVGPAGHRGSGMSAANQKLFAWCGLACAALFLFGFVVLAGWVPPPAPTHSIHQVVAFFQHHTTLKRIGLWMNTIAGALCGAWVVAITMQMRRIEGASSPLAFLQLIMGPLLVFEFIIPVQLWQACLYRPAIDPGFTYRLNDFAWLFFVGVVSTAVVQAIAIGLAILQDKRAELVFPRWVGYFNLWCAVLFLPGGMVVFFKTGPLAWNGLLAWWLVLAAFTIWLIVMSVVLLRHAIPQQEREGRAEQAAQWDSGSLVSSRDEPVEYELREPDGRIIGT